MQVQRQACWALLTLAASDRTAGDVARKGGVKAIVAAMVNFTADPSVQHFGCWALANITWAHEKVRTTAKNEGAAEVIAAAINRFPRHAGIVEKGRLALTQLAGRDAPR